MQHCCAFKRCKHCWKKHCSCCDGCAGCATLLQEAPFMRRRWLCRLCSTTDDGYAGCAEGIEPNDAMTTMTCLFVLACFCLPLSVEPFLCPLVCSSCFAHLLLRASDVEVTAVSACWPASVKNMAAVRHCLSVLSFLFYALPTNIRTYKHKHTLYSRFPSPCNARGW